jgi:hypothetical protein
MHVIAKMSRPWMVRMLLVGFVFSGFSGWCVYDGLVRYPAFNRAASEYNRLVRLGTPGAWERLAAERGWPAHFRSDDLQPDGTVRLKTAWDIRTQFFMAGLCLLVVLPAFLRILWARAQTMTADEEGFVALDGTRVPYAAVREIDWSRWERKSIAVVIYELDGRLRRATIADWIFAGSEEILRRISERSGVSWWEPGTDDAANATDKTGETDKPPETGDKSNDGQEAKQA